MRRIALIGFGEAGTILGEELVRAGAEVTAYDILVHAGAAQAEPVRQRTAAAGVALHSSHAEAVAGAELVVSAVTAASADEAACEAGRCLQTGQFYLDINSVSPATRRAAAERVEASGAAYVEAAVMAPVPPYRAAVPMLLGGAHAAALAPRLQALGWNVRPFAERVGDASAVKLCRSVVIKGLEALTVEALFAARRFGVEEPVLESLGRTYPHMGWADSFPDYTVSRVAEHGERRSAELDEAVRTLSEAGVAARMAAAGAEAQRALVTAMRDAGIVYDASEPFQWRRLADALERED